MNGNDKTQRLEVVARAMLSDEQNLHTEQDGWLKEHEGFFYYPLAKEIYESIAREQGIDPGLLQVEILKFESGASIKPHHHGNSDGIIVQIHSKEGEREVLRVHLLSVGSDGMILSRLLEREEMFHIPRGLVHGFENNTAGSILLLSIQSDSTEADTHWF